LTASRSGELDLSRVRDLGVYGGSFDPVHAGHVHVASSAQRAFALDQVLFVPAARPPHKPGRVLATPEDRRRMLEIALEREPSWSISTLEFERDGPSYTYDTLRELRDRARLSPVAELYFLIGWDNLRGLERWHRAREMLELAQPIVVWRGEEDQRLLAHLRRELGDERFAKLERGLLRIAPAPESSTDLRARLGRGEDPGASLPPGVWEYIRTRGIYGVQGDGER